MGWAQDVHSPGWRTWVRAHQELLLSVALLALAGTLFVDEPFAGAVPPRRPDNPRNHHDAALIRVSSHRRRLDQA
jgi:hypothetical protein